MSNYRTALDDALDSILGVFEKKSGEQVTPEQKQKLAEEIVDRVRGLLHIMSTSLKPGQQFFLTNHEGLETSVLNSLAARIQFIYFGEQERYAFAQGIVSVLEHMTRMIGPRQKPLIRDAMLVVIDGRIAILGLVKEKREPLLQPLPGWTRARVVRYGST